LTLNFSFLLTFHRYFPILKLTLNQREISKRVKFKYIHIRTLIISNLLLSHSSVPPA